MSKTQSLPLRSHGQVGEEGLLPRGSRQYVPDDQKSHAGTTATDPMAGCALPFGQRSTQELGWNQLFHSITLM